MSRTLEKKKQEEVYHPTEVGWYWYQPTPEELESLTVVSDQCVEIRKTKEGVLMAEFIREVRSVSKLKGKWSAKLKPTYLERTNG